MSNVLSLRPIPIESESAEPYLVFSNPGTLDVNLIKLLGVSVKDSDNAIGFFGTGLKYAIASTLRLGGEVVIFTNGERFDFKGEILTLREKEFTRVTINGEPLGFTTELGKQWEPWMVVRELYSNALDELGDTSVQSQPFEELQKKSSNQTIVVLCGELFLDVWKDRASYFISPSEQPVHSSVHVDAYSDHFSGRAIFYRGIRVYHGQKPLLYRYNIRERIDLTEDRTAKYGWQINESLERSIVTSEDADFINRLLTCGDDFYESGLTFGDSSHQSLAMSDAFQSVCSTLAARKPQRMNRYAVKYYLDRTQKAAPMVTVSLSPVQAQQLEKAKAFLQSLGFVDSLEDYPIQVVSWLGEGVYGMAKDRTIFLTKQAFDAGTKKLAAIILEEYVHNHFNLGDETREMQSFLFEKLVTIGEEFVMREPL